VFPWSFGSKADVPLPFITLPLHFSHQIHIISPPSVTSISLFPSTVMGRRVGGGKEEKKFTWRSLKVIYPYLGCIFSYFVILSQVSIPCNAEWLQQNLLSKFFWKLTVWNAIIWIKGAKLGNGVDFERHEMKSSLKQQGNTFLVV
jgi:hypothetical protein